MRFYATRGYCGNGLAPCGTYRFLFFVHSVFLQARELTFRGKPGCSTILRFLLKPPYFELASFEPSMMFHYNIPRPRKPYQGWEIPRLDILNGILCGIWSSLATVLVVDVLAAFRR